MCCLVHNNNDMEMHVYGLLNVHWFSNTSPILKLARQSLWNFQRMAVDSVGFVCHCGSHLSVPGTLLLIKAIRICENEVK